MAGPEKPRGSRPPGKSLRKAGPRAGRPGLFHKPPGAGEREDGLSVLYGHHTVFEALKNPRRVFHRLLATENAAHKLEEALGALQDPRALPLPVTPVRPGDIGRQLTPDAVHQGVMLLAEPLPALTLDDLPPEALVVALDEVTDPHNVGAILRTAAAFAVDALLVTTRHSPAMTGVLAKSASGALEHVPLVTVGNLGKALDALGERGFMRIGLDSDAEVALGAVTPARPLVLVLGAEGKGLRPVTRQRCDVVAALPMQGAIRSLNVSNAAAIALYALATAG